jgi:hypothetical protein
LLRELVKSIMAFDWSAKTNSVPDTAEELGCSAWELYALIRRDESPVPIIRLGRKIVVPTAGLRRLLLLLPEEKSS